MPAALFGLLQIALLSGCIALGARKREQLGRHAWLFGSAALVYEIAFVLVLVCYQTNWQDPSAQLLFGFPLPSAVMLFALWPAPLTFVLIFLATFDRWFLTADDVEQFKRIVDANRAQ